MRCDSVEKNKTTFSDVVLTDTKAKLKLCYEFSLFQTVRV